MSSSRCLCLLLLLLLLFFLELLLQLQINACQGFAAKEEGEACVQKSHASTNLLPLRMLALRIGVLQWMISWLLCLLSMSSQAAMTHSLGTIAMQGMNFGLQNLGKTEGG